MMQWFPIGTWTCYYCFVILGKLVNITHVSVFNSTHTDNNGVSISDLCRFRDFMHVRCFTEYLEHSQCTINVNFHESLGPQTKLYKRKYYNLFIISKNLSQARI
jgi:hypothetical protein